MLVIGLLGVAVLVWSVVESRKPGPLAEDKIVVIEREDDSGTIGDQLERAGVVEGLGVELERRQRREAAGAADRVHPGRGHGRSRPGLGGNPCRNRYKSGVADPAGREPDVTPPIFPCSEIA